MVAVNLLNVVIDSAFRYYFTALYADMIFSALRDALDYFTVHYIAFPLAAPCTHRATTAFFLADIRPSRYPVQYNLCSCLPIGGSLGLPK